jgi:SnoaL-like domain
VTARATIEAFEDHLARRSHGDIEGDLERNYARDVILLCEHGVLKGHAAVRNSAKALAEQLSDARFEYPVKAIHGENVLLHWRARSTKAYVDVGLDTFVVRDGRIVLQTVSYQLKYKT